MKYTIDYVYLSDHDYLDLEELIQKVEGSDGSVSKKRATSWTFDSLTFTYTLSCPMGSPAFLDQCGE